jgi:hypothetical protein
MDAPAQKPRRAWQPLTAGGVAAFGSATWRRLFGVQVVFALLASASVMWCLGTAWFPVFREAIHNLPDRGAIKEGKLEWSAASPQRLAGNRFVSVAVDPEHAGGAVSTAHLQIEIGNSDLKLISFLGFSLWRYPADLRVPLNNPGLEPWWGAWAPAILALAGLSTLAGLLLSWIILAAIYTGPVWLLGFFLNRDLDLRASWRLAGAALLPGCLFMSALIFFYSLRMMDGVRLAAGLLVHIVIGWAYCIAGTIARPRTAEALAAKGNPFAQAPRG